MGCKMNSDQLSDHFLELIRRTSACLPHDVEAVIKSNRFKEEHGSRAEFALQMILRDIDLAKHLSLPICQDTGTLNFYVRIPAGIDQLQIQAAAKQAVAKATEKGYLRQNSVDSLSGKNSGNNLGPGSPLFHFQQVRGDVIDVRLILKGGGCENMGAQYKLPGSFTGKKVGRDLQGVHACVMDALVQAQGNGCSPGFLGVCIGGDRASGYETAKAQFLRPIDDVNPIPDLAALESRIVRDANELEIGPMGFSGKFTLGACKIAALNRLPACYFVTIAYMCWAFRRRGFILTSHGRIAEWLYQSPGEFDCSSEMPAELEFDPKQVKKIHTPLTEASVRTLEVGDVVLFNGTLFTGRDAVHRYLYDGGELDAIRNGVIYHCGPVVLGKEGDYKVVAAGPTTSVREEPYMAAIIEKFGIRAVIGKGGMGEQTRRACREHGAVYLHAVGGAAQIYARCVIKVVGVHLEQFGSPEAVWELQVQDFPLVVTIDAHGNSMHTEVEAHSKELLNQILHR